MANRQLVIPSEKNISHIYTGKDSNILPNEWKLKIMWVAAYMKV